MAIDKNEHLNSVISSHMKSKEEKLYEKFKTRRNEVKEALEKKYGEDMYAPFNSGSYAKNTSINVNFDFDMMVPFKKGKFKTLEEMFDDVGDFLKEKFETELKVAVVKKQRVSIGIVFSPDAEGDIVKIDAVPGRELQPDSFEKDDYLNLYVYSRFGKIEAGNEYIQTNIQLQIDEIKNRATSEKDSIRKVIRLLKVWKYYNQKEPKSFFIELITMKAFDKNDISGGIWDKLKAVMEFIRDEVEKIKLPDPGNEGGNDVADTLDDNQKKALSTDMKHMLERIEENSDNIKLYFKVNPKHASDESDKKKYTVKEERPSAPPAKQFG